MPSVMSHRCRNGRSDLRILDTVAGRRERLKKARKAAGLTQEELAYRVGVDRSTVGRWEAGENEPQPWLRRKIAQHLGVTPAHLDALLDGPADRTDAAGDPFDRLAAVLD